MKGILQNSIFSFVLWLLLYSCLSSQSSSFGTISTTKWTSKNLFEQKVFIQNKGQFAASTAERNSEVEYAVFCEGVEIDFTLRGVRYKCNKVERSKDESLNNSNTDVYIDWPGANPNPEISPSDPVTYNYTYPDPLDKSGKKTIRAAAFKKITYKNLYPGIDLEYTFPENKEGIKYAFIVNPGADHSVIKMKYAGAGGILTDSLNGNLILKSAFGDITDHAPYSYYRDEKKEILSSFVLKENVISFKLQQYNQQQAVVIDPWTTLPTFTGNANNAYDVEYDFQGNVYIYGGSVAQYAGGPLFQEIKLDQNGVIQWIFSTTFLNNTNNAPNYIAYGDFAVDGATGTSYLVEGFNSGVGARVVKINTSGTQSGFFSGTSSFLSMTRIVINNCTHKAIIGGGGDTPAGDLGCVLDTSLSSLSSVNITGDRRHITAGIALDNDNNGYMLTTQASFGINPAFDNAIVKLPAATLSPVTFVVPSNYSLSAASNTFSGPVPDGYPGFNGMAVNDNFLYTYDGELIQRWNKNTGILLDSLTINPGISFLYGSHTVRSILCSGLAVDDCDNIYAGVNASVIVYDTNFTTLATIPLADTVYDIRLGPGNMLYACGQNFVTAIQLNTVCNPLNINIYNPACTDTLKAIVTGGTGPYKYVWSNGSTEQTISGLTSGSYVVTVSDSSCTPKIHSDTITITTHSIEITGDTLICSGESTVLTASGGVTYLWNTGAMDSAIVVAPASTASYTVTATTSLGCPDTAIITVNVIPRPVVTANSAGICPFDSVTIKATGAATYLWSTSSIADSITVSPDTTTIYTVIGTMSGCKDTVMATVTVYTPPSADAGTDDSLCFGMSITLNAVPNGSSYSYDWAPTTGLSNTTIYNPIASPLSTTTYTVIITDQNGCSGKDSNKIVVDPQLQLAKTAIDLLCNAVCDGQVIVIPSGGTAPYTYSWTNGCTSASCNNLCAGTYTVLVTDAFGCNITDDTLVAEPPALAAAVVNTTPVSCHTFCDGIATVTASGGVPGSSGYSYSWNTVPAQTTVAATGLCAGTYSCIIKDQNNCADTISVTITEPLPVVIESIVPPEVCVSANTTLTVIASGGNGGYAYAWDAPGTPGFSMADTAVVNPVTTTTYTISVTDIKGCTSMPVSITLYPLPDITFIADSSQGCAPLCINFTDASSPGSGNITSWNWDFGDGSIQSALQNPEHCYTSPGQYSVILSVESDNGCIATDTVNNMITVFSNPEAAFNPSPNPANVLEPEVFMNNQSSLDVNYWYWNFGDGTTLAPADSNPVHTYPSTIPGSYFATLIVQNANGCYDTATQEIIVNPEFTFFIPNSFTPNEDGINDYFFGTGIGISEYNLWVFDRWGNMIFYADDISKYWNGRVKNSAEVAQRDVYVWKVKLTDVFGIPHQYIGAVTLVR